MESKTFEVYLVKNDGTKKLWAEFVSKYWAYYHIALAKSTSGVNGCIDYSDYEFEVVER